MSYHIGTMGMRGLPGLAALALIACGGGGSGAQEPPAGPPRAVEASGGALTADEVRALDLALGMAGLARKDLEFRKDVYPAEGILPVVREALAKPLGALARMGDWPGLVASESLAWGYRVFDADVMGGGPAVRLDGLPAAGDTEGHRRLLARVAPPKGLAGKELARLAALPDPLRWWIVSAALSLPVLEEEREEALAALSAEEKRLIEGWALRHVLAPDEEFPNFRPRKPRDGSSVGRPDPEAATLAALLKVRVPLLAQVAASLRYFSHEGVKAARDAPPNALEALRVPLTLTTRSGVIGIGGPGDDAYPRGPLPAVLLDVGGNDTYRGQGIGGTECGLALLVDSSGDDTYVGSDFSLGGALLGVAVLHDASGNDTYRGGLVTQGAAIAGVGILVDGGGEDDYRAERHAQGAGLAGIGILQDREPLDERKRESGRDRYQVACFGQGFARTGGAGLLLDEWGNDLYQAGGAYPYRPAHPHRHYSHAQGYAIGIREFGYAGGVGMLLDLAGSDRYLAEMHAQGAACWYGLGVLADMGGDDHYAATGIAQGGAVHLAAGVLLEAGGDDEYVLSDGLGQGGAHDFAVGILHDRGGNDRYLTRAGGQGIALTNGVGLLVDRYGDDLYAGHAGHLQGAGRPGRGLGSLGILLDCGGADRYTEGRPEGAAWSTTDRGVGADLPTPEPAPPAKPPPARVPAPEETLSPAEFERLFAEASLWNVGEARPAVAAARAQIVAWGERALPHLRAKLLLWQPPVLLALDEILSGIARERRPAVVKLLTGCLSAPEPPVRASALLLSGKLGVREAAAAVLAALREPGMSRFAAPAAGALRLSEALPDLQAMAGSADWTENAVGIRALGALGDPRALPALLDALGRPVFQLRDAAARACAALGAAAAEPLLARCEDRSLPGPARLAALEGVARLEAASRPESLPGRLVKLLEDPDPPVRAAAGDALSCLSGLQGAGDALARAAETDADPAVRRRLRMALDVLRAGRPRRGAESLFSNLAEYPEFFGGG